jgi:hypothetical protein
MMKYVDDGLVYSHTDFACVVLGETFPVIDLTAHGLAFTPSLEL